MPRHVDWYVHVDRGIIDRNRKRGLNDPPVTVRRGKSGRSTKHFEVRLPAGSVMIYDINGVLNCGAKVAIRCPSEPEHIR